MRSQAKQRPCAFCGTVTRFEMDVVGPRGGVETVPACVLCGEEPARREEFAKSKPGLNWKAAA